MNQPLGNLIFRIIEEALEKDARRRMGKPPSALDMEEAVESGPRPGPAPKRDLAELKERLIRKAKASRIVPERTYASRAKPEPIPAAVAKPKPEAVVAGPSPAAAPLPRALQAGHRPALRRWLVGQIILGPCKALEGPGA